MEDFMDPIKILDDIGIKTANFTAAAATDLITSNAHGLKSRDMVVLTTTDTLPAGLATNTVYYVINETTNTFQLSAQKDGSPVNITDAGTGTHTFTMHDIGYAVLADGFKHIQIEVNSDGGADAAMTVKLQTSNQKDMPDFSAAQSKTNSWDYAETVDGEDGAIYDGDTGIVFSSADDHRKFELNTNHARWVCAIISGWTAGEVTVKVSLSN